MLNTSGIISVVLGSSVVSGLVTVIYNMVRDNRQSMMDNVTSERKRWRDKIRELAINIEHSEYKGFSDRNINGYLSELEVNINAYGKCYIFSFEQDSHIWETCEAIRIAKSKKEFEMNKEMLLYYISLMLKQDWERSKREVIGNRSILKHVAVIMLGFLWMGFFWFGVCNFDSISEFLIWNVWFIIFSIIIPLIVDNGFTSSFMKQRKLDYKRYDRYAIVMLLVLLGCSVLIVIFSILQSERLHLMIKDDIVISVYFFLLFLIWLSELGLVFHALLDKRIEKIQFFNSIVKTRYRYLDYNVISIPAAIGDIKSLLQMDTCSKEEIHKKMKFILHIVKNMKDDCVGRKEGLKVKENRKEKYDNLEKIESLTRVLKRLKKEIKRCKYHRTFTEQDKKSIFQFLDQLEQLYGTKF